MPLPGSERARVVTIRSVTEIKSIYAPDSPQVQAYDAIYDPPPLAIDGAAAFLAGRSATKVPALDLRCGTGRAGVGLIDMTGHSDFRKSAPADGREHIWLSRPA